jgi:hypothetical protein
LSHRRSLSPALIACQIYEICERNGRIAYRRAGGSRLITSNDHWKSQVRHALYTGGRFQRVALNSEYWQLVPAHAHTAAELIKVLVRADDPTCGITASTSLPPSMARARSVHEQPQTQTQTRRPAAAAATSHRPARLRRKRSMRGGEGSDDEAPAPRGRDGSAEAICDSVDPASPGAKLRSPRIGGAFADPSDDHSTQEWEDKMSALPRLRATRTSARPPGFNTPTPRPSPASLQRAASRTIGHRGSGNASLDSEDPSMLRWGSTGLRSCITVVADSGASLSAGRTPASGARCAVPRTRAPSAEADSPPYLPWFAAPAPDGRRGSKGPPAKRRVSCAAGL